MSDNRVADLTHVSDMGSASSRPELERYLGSTALKRRASPSFEGFQDATSRKRLKGDAEDNATSELVHEQLSVDGQALVEDLAEALQCGCCAGLVYRPVAVSPCQHFLCGSCCVLWIKHGGTSCPECRGHSTIVTPSRPLQTMIDVLLRAAPYKARTEGERQQADELYKGGTSMRIPAPRESSPEPNTQSGEFARPCPHCLPGNPFGWRCPLPIPDPNTDIDHAWHIEDGIPPGHAYCGNCENLLAARAPSTTKCDLCQVSFCGIGVQSRCLAAPLMSQHPHGMSDVIDLVQSEEVYECFDSNTVEVEFLVDYLTTQRLTPRHIYREIVAHIQSQPRGFLPLIELDLFVDVHGVPASVDPNPDSPRNRICRLCATEVLLWGLRNWWIRERQKGFLEENVTSRRDCSDGTGCQKQKDIAHAKEFNHIIANPILEQAVPSPIPDIVPTDNAASVSSAFTDGAPRSAASIADVHAPPSLQDIRTRSLSHEFHDAFGAALDNE